MSIYINQIAAHTLKDRVLAESFPQTNKLVFTTMPAATWRGTTPVFLASGTVLRYVEATGWVVVGNLYHARRATENALVVYGLLEEVAKVQPGELQALEEGLTSTRAFAARFTAHTKSQMEFANGAAQKALTALRQSVRHAITFQSRTPSKQAAYYFLGALSGVLKEAQDPTTLLKAAEAAIQDRTVEVMTIGEGLTQQELAIRQCVAKTIQNFNLVALWLHALDAQLFLALRHRAVPDDLETFVKILHMLWEMETGLLCTPVPQPFTVYQERVRNEVHRIRIELEQRNFAIATELVERALHAIRFLAVRQMEEELVDAMRDHARLKVPFDTRKMGARLFACWDAAEKLDDSGFAVRTRGPHLLELDRALLASAKSDRRRALAHLVTATQML